MDSLFPDPKVDRLMDALQRVPGWPADGPKDEEFARRLILQYPTTNLVEQVQRWGTWLEANREAVPANSNLRSRFVTWCKNGERYGVQRRAQGRGTDRRPRRDGGRPSQGAGSRAGAFAGYAEGAHRLDDW